MADDLLARVIEEIEDRKSELAAAVREHNRLEAARVALEGMADSGSKGAGQDGLGGPGEQARRVATPVGRDSGRREALTERPC